jgi:hypothetical protein
MNTLHMEHPGIARMFRELNDSTAAWRRRWAHLHADHARRTMAMITSAIGACGHHEDATILGLGSGVEFGDAGLEAIASAFRHVRVVDIDVETARRTVERLPAPRRLAVDVIEADASGNKVVQFCEQADRIVDESASESEAIARAIPLVRGLAPCDVLPVAHADFICSSLVMTQFGSGIERYLRERLKEKFGRARRSSAAYARFVQAVGGAADKMHVEHVQNLHRWVRPGGAVYFADTMLELQGTGTGDSLDAVTWQSPPMFSKLDLDALMVRMFDVRGRDRWLWVKKEQASKSPEPARLAYVVAAYELGKPA